VVKKRLDSLLVERGLVTDLGLAQKLVMAGQVRVDGQGALAPSESVASDADLAILRGPRFVSRGGEKLLAALDTFGVQVGGLTCADVGASTGGFTDCLLQAGACKVYAIDVGEGILDWSLRQDARVVVMEKTNARLLASLPEPIALVTLDASFISLRTLLPVVKDWLAPQAQVIALVKPQFEAERSQAARARGVIREPAVHRQALQAVFVAAQEAGLGLVGAIRSPLLGPKGNVEFLGYWRYPVVGFLPAPEIILAGLGLV